MDKLDLTKAIFEEQQANFAVMALVVAVVVICVCAATGVSTVLTLIDSLRLWKRAGHDHYDKKTHSKEALDQDFNNNNPTTTTTRIVAVVVGARCAAACATATSS
jgi:hypothetical protein